MSEQEAMEEVEHIRSKLIDSVGDGLFPNWVGPQRFGAGRPVTAEVGKHVLNGDFKQATLTYLSMEGYEENAEVANNNKVEAKIILILNKVKNIKTKDIRSTFFFN